MKTLNDILEARTNPNFPVIGRNGYGGEQDGSHPILAGFSVWSREEAKNIRIPNFLQLNWAEYHPTYGWEGAVGYWSDQEISEGDKKLLRQNCFQWV